MIIKKNTEKQKQDEKLKEEMSKRFCAIRMSYGANQKGLSGDELVNQISIVTSKRPKEELGEKTIFCLETYRRWEKGKHLPDLKWLVWFRLYLDPHPNLNYLITGHGPMFLPLSGPQLLMSWETLSQRLKEFRENQPNPLTGKPYKVKEIAEVFGCSSALWRKYERVKVKRSETSEKSGNPEKQEKEKQEEEKQSDDNCRSVPLRVLYQLHTKFGVDLNFLICGV